MKIMLLGSIYVQIIGIYNKIKNMPYLELVKIRHISWLLHYFLKHLYSDISFRISLNVG